MTLSKLSRTAGKFVTSAENSLLGTLSTSIDYAQWRSDLAARFAEAGDDAERAIDAIRHFQQGETFRLLLKDIAGLLPLETLSDHLSALADAVVEVTLAHLLKTANLPGRATLAVIAYGRWGGKELGYASDLDLIFLMPDDAALRPGRLESRAAVSGEMDERFKSHAWKACGGLTAQIGRAHV